MTLSSRQAEVHMEHLMDMTGALVEYDGERDLFLLNRNGRHYVVKWFSADNWDVYYGAIRDDKSVRVKWNDSVRVWNEALQFTEAVEVWGVDNYPLFQVIPELDRHGVLRDVTMSKSGDTMHLWLNIVHHFEDVVVTYDGSKYVRGEGLTEDDTIRYPAYAATALGLAHQVQAQVEELEAYSA